MLERVSDPSKNAPRLEDYPFEDYRFEDDHPGPIWGAFRTLQGSVERLVVLNLFWSLQLLPGVMGLGFGTWPLWLRTLLVGYTLLVLPGATMVVYALVRRACEGEEPTVAAAGDALRELAAAGFRALAPLVAALGFVLWGIMTIAGEPPFLTLEVLLRTLLLLGLLLMSYWGPALAEERELSPLALLARSWRYAVRSPGLTLKSFAAVLLTMVVGAVSVGGLFLIVFVLVALLQTHALLELRRHTPAPTKLSATPNREVP